MTDMCQGCQKEAALSDSLLCGDCEEAMWEMFCQDDKVDMVQRIKDDQWIFFDHHGRMSKRFKTEAEARAAYEEDLQEPVNSL